MSIAIPTSLRQEVWDQFSGQCAYCRSPHSLMDAFFEVDHIIPVVAGGATDKSNLALACPHCNRYKGRSQRAIDVVSGKSMPIFHPQRQTWSRHFVWSDDHLTIIGRTASGRATVRALRMNDDTMVGVREIWLLAGALAPDWSLGINL